MKNQICLLFATLILSACNSPLSDGGSDAADLTPDASVGPTDEDILADYDAEVRTYQEEVGMPGEWRFWMLERKDRWSNSYIRGRRDHEAHVYVRYEREIAYDPPWSSEEEHYAALEQLAELQYPGWDFTFSVYEDGVEDNLERNDVVAVLGHSGDSNASGRTIYLLWEGIFSHEFGHTLGLRHHYCGGAGADYCPDAYPPGENKCTMDRNSSSFGPTEIFLLQLTGERPEDEINAAWSNINSRYPEGYPNN